MPPAVAHCLSTVLERQSTPSKTGVGSLLPATPEERAQELVRNRELIERLKQRQRESVEKGAEWKAH